MRYLLSTLTFLLLPFWGSTQNYTNQVVSLFNQGERGIWVRQYEGLSNDIHSTSVVLGHSEKEYKGLLLEKGKSPYFLEGERNRSKIQLLVMDDDQSVVGYIQGSIQDSMIMGEWNNTVTGVSKTIFLERVLSISQDVPCGKDKWIKTYEGPFLKDDAQVFIQREDEGQLYGVVHLEKEEVSYVLRSGTATLSQKSNPLLISNNIGTPLGQLTWQELEGAFAQATLSDNSVFLFEQSAHYPMVCGSQIIHGIQLSYVFPEFGILRFDKWLRRKVNIWLKSFEAELVRQLAEGEEFQLWVDFDHIGTNVISGIIHRRMATGSQESEDFIFDLNEGRAIDFLEWIDEAPKFQSFLDRAVAGEKKRNVLKEEVAARDWYNEQEFSKKTLRREGLCLHTSFDAIFGVRSMVVPWDVLDDYLKRPGRIKKKLK